MFNENIELGAKVFRVVKLDRDMNHAEIEEELNNALIPIDHSLVGEFNNCLIFGTAATGATTAATSIDKAISELEHMMEQVKVLADEDYIPKDDSEGEEEIDWSSIDALYEDDTE